jgi:hypothetical protein
MERLMPNEATPRSRSLIPLTALLVAAACGGSDAPKAAGEDAPAASGTAEAGPAAQAPDACTFFSRAELEEAVGWELREGEPEDAPAGASICDFETPPGMSVTRTFPNPALPKSVGFGSLMINTHASDPREFAQFRQTLGAEAEDVPGIGDGAYFYGLNLLYVRVGNLGFSVRIYTDALSEADRGRVREVMLKLGRMGAARVGR